MTFEEIKQGEETYIMHIRTFSDCAGSCGKGATLWGTDGRNTLI